MFCGRTFCVRTFNVQDLSYSRPFEAAPFVAGLLEPNISSQHLLNVKSAHSRTDVHVHFSFNKYPIYTHDGASAKFSTNSHKTDNSVQYRPGLAENVQFNWAHLYIVS
jgi:hypothetical protein